MAKHPLRHECRPPKKGEGQQDEPGQRHQLELDQRDEQLYGKNEKGEDYDHPGQQQHRDLDEIGEKRGESHHLGRGREKRFACI